MIILAAASLANNSGWNADMKTVKTSSASGNPLLRPLIVAKNVAITFVQSSKVQ